VAPGAQPPVEWSETKNIRWKTAVPGKGHSTPIIWGERVFLTTAIPYGEPVKPRIPSRPGAHDNLAMTHHHEFAVLAISRKSGKILWQQTVHKELPHEAGHVSASLASASPVTDGEHVFAFFGSRGLYCLDTGGKLLWKKNLGEMHTKHGHGEGSSPALHGETLIVNWDHEEQSFLVALDKRTGTQRWRVARAEDTSWATPIVVEHAGKTQVIVSGTNRLRGYDLLGLRHETSVTFLEFGQGQCLDVARPAAANRCGTGRLADHVQRGGRPRGHARGPPGAG
jgi:outer membrane protein assembly factor BamB